MQTSKKMTLKCQVGDVIASRMYPDNTYRVDGVFDWGVNVVKLTQDPNHKPIYRKPIGHNFDIPNFHLSTQHYFFMSQVQPLSVSIQATEFAKPENKCGCDCGAFITYQSENQIYHANWCSLFAKVLKQ